MGWQERLQLFELSPPGLIVAEPKQCNLVAVVVTRGEQVFGRMRLKEGVAQFNATHCRRTVSQSWRTSGEGMLPPIQISAAMWSDIARLLLAAEAAVGLGRIDDVVGVVLEQHC